MLNVNGLDTRPSRLSRHGATSTTGLDMWLRTKKCSVGVIQEVKADMGVSMSSGRAERTIISCVAVSAPLEENAAAKAPRVLKKFRLEVVMVVRVSI